MSLGSMIKDLQRQKDLIITPQVDAWLRSPQSDGALLPSDIEQKVLGAMQAVPRDRRASFSASSSGECPRKQVLSYLGVEVMFAPDARLSNIFSDGKWRHTRWQTMLLSCGALDDIEVPLTWSRRRVKGSMDGQGVVPHDHMNLDWRGVEFGFELKGVNPFGYAKAVKAGRPMSGHMEQVQKYMLLSGLELFSIVYENKGTNEWHEWVVTPDKELQDKAREEIDTLNEAIDKQELPPPLPSCMAAIGDDWGRCAYAGTAKGHGPCMAILDPKLPFLTLSNADATMA